MSTTVPCPVAGCYLDGEHVHDLTGTWPAVWPSVPPGHVGITDPPPVPLHDSQTCDRCGVTDVAVRHDSASGINLHEPATCPIMVAEMPPASSPAHDPLACPCCQAWVRRYDSQQRSHREQADMDSSVISSADAREAESNAAIRLLAVALSDCVRVLRGADWYASGTAGEAKAVIDRAEALLTAGGCR